MPALTARPIGKFNRLCQKMRSVFGGRILSEIHVGVENPLKPHFDTIKGEFSASSKHKNNFSTAGKRQEVPTDLLYKIRVHKSIDHVSPNLERPSSSRLRMLNKYRN
jgi:hypothetical protein